VFGPEDTGLTNEHLDACSLLTTVPLAAPQPSINLAQAVMVYAYALSELPALARDAGAADDTSYAAAAAEVTALAETLGIGADARIDAWLRERLPLLPARDLRMLFNLLRVRDKRGL
jgi:tRNA/rRNA methyltransferase